MRSWAQTQLAASRWILRALGLLAGVSVAASAAFLHFIVMTPGGLQFVVTNFPQRIGSVTIELSGVTGTLGKEVRIERLDIDHERVHLELNDIRGSIALPGLLHQSLTVPEVAVRLLTITMKPRVRPPRPSGFHFLPQWMVIRAHRVMLGTLTVILPSGRHVQLTHLGGAGIVRPSVVEVVDSYGTLGALSAHAMGRVGATDPLQVQGDGDIKIHFDGQPDWLFRASINGTLADLPFRGVIDAPMRATLAGRALDLTGNWHWTSEGDVQEFTLLPWKGGNLLGVITGHVSASGDSKGFGGRGPLASSGLHAGLFDAAFHGSYADGTVTADHMEVTHRGSHAHATGSGTIKVVEHGPRLDLRGSWTDFRWPLAGSDAAVGSRSGDFHLSGVWPYAVESQGTMSIPRLPWFTDVPVEMTGALDHDHLDIHEAMVSAVSGATELNGKVYWPPTPRWSAAGTSTGIDAGLIRPDVPGRLNFAFDATGNGFDTTQDFDIHVHSLGGTLRKVAARGDGRFGRHRGNWAFDHVRANLGGTNIALDGAAGDRLDLRFSLASDDLTLLGIGAGGRLDAQGAIGGSLKSPHLELTAKGGQIAYGGAQLQSLDANVDVDAARTGASSARVTLRDVSYGKRKIDRIVLALDGTAQQHGIDMKMDAESLHGESRVAGTFVEGTWRGQLQNMMLKGSDALNLTLDKPVALMTSTTAARIESFCLKGSPAHLCADADWTPAHWSTHASASDLPMSALTSGLPQDVKYQGTINFAAEAFGGRQLVPQGQIRAELADAQLLHREASKRITKTTLGSGYVLVQARESSIDGEVSLDAGEVGTIKGRVTAQRTAPDMARMPLQGSLRLRTDELGFISLYVPEIDRAAGNIDADLAVAGTLGDPRLSGTVKLSNAELNLYQVNFVMRQTSLDARLHDNQLDFTGSAQIGPGRARSQGHLEWHDSLPHGRVELSGENLRVTDIPEAQIDASPNLVFAIDGRRLDVTGRVAVPFARIQPVDLTGAVRTSADEVIVGADAPQAGPSFDVTSAITLALGDKVSIDTQGLTGRLTGNIDLRTGTDNITRGTGELQIAEGKYAAYGRKLDIQKGRLIFTGGPVANPGVDIRAVKQFPENVAGINVRGTLLQPRMSFFSEPSLPQSQIVSLILAGGSFSGEDSTIVSPTRVSSGGERTAGNELLAQGGAILAQQLGAQLGLSSRLGIEDVTIESDLNNDTALVLGRYLSPRLYVSYGISLTEALNTVKLRYSLNDHWTVRTEVGVQHSAELVYTIEK